MSRRSVAFGLLVELACCMVAGWVPRQTVAADADPFSALGAEYAKNIRPAMSRYCLGCHSTAKHEGELDLERYSNLGEIRRSPQSWQKVATMLDNGEMPPKDAKQPSTAQRSQLRGWVGRYLNAEALSRSGDPGPVVLRRLSNSEYTYTVQDLTALPLEPARDFPVDGAAGEGFTNTGNALVMSPSLLTKYLDAGKDIARHAVLLPDGFRFAPGTTRRDWTDEILRQIREVYGQYADAEGTLPIEKYLAASLSSRHAIEEGQLTPGEVAAKHGLNPRYFALLWHALNDRQRSPLLDPLRTAWRNARPGDAPALAARIGQWQKALSRFQSVGHMKSWVVPVDPVMSRQEIRVKIGAGGTDRAVTLYLAAGTAGDGKDGDFVVWESPRLVTPGRPDLPLRDVRGFTREMADRRTRVFSSAAKCLAAVSEASTTNSASDRRKLAQRHAVDPEVLTAWLDYLGIGSGGSIALDHFSSRITSSSGYDFVKGWGTSETPLLVANSSGQHVRVPGNLPPHSLAVHPSPTLSACIGWLSPIAGTIQARAQVTHAHPECGNGVTWSLELRRGATRQRLAAGVSAGATPVSVGPIDSVAVQPGDLVSLVIGPRDHNHACDLTDVELIVTQAGADKREWNLSRDVSGDILAGNPHADRFGNRDTWHFYTEPDGGPRGPVIPAGSLLARWQSAENKDVKQQFAQQLQELLQHGPSAKLDKKHPDAVLYRQLSSLGGPLFAGARSTTSGAKAASPDRAKTARAIHSPDEWGLDPALFGRHPNGSAIATDSLCVQAPSLLEIRLPADLVAGSEFVVAGTLHPKTGADGSVQLHVGTDKPKALDRLRSGALVLVGPSSASRKRFEAMFTAFRRDFPAALSYTKIVPVDEAVTLTLFHREDEPLCRLMLDASQKAKLDRLWEELHFISHDALTQVDAFLQLMEYATQDSDPRLFEPYRKPIYARAAAFRKELIETEPRQVESLIEFAARAYRRPLANAESRELRGLYQRLRKEGLAHDQAFRLTLARIFVAPAFLYRLEEAGRGEKPAAVSQWELACRLSYFLWSSQPDRQLADVARTGKLADPEVLASQAKRMLRDSRVRRLSIEFFCQWLHIRDFDSLNEKSEREFPEFVTLRGDMYEESIRFFTDLFQRDGSVLDLLDSDHTFVNGALAKYYGIPGVTGPEWRRVDGIHQYSRGGVLGLATVLAKESGASRSSPTLRGNWVAEVLLGDRLPRPPKDVPKLPEEENAGVGLTVRRMVEKHASDARCSACHVRIDPYGFALEEFDAIGRFRSKDRGGRPIDTRTKVQDGSQFEGIDGLRRYLLVRQREVVLKQFCRKLLGYALGRSVQLSDAPLLAKMQHDLENSGCRISVAIETIVRSPQFRNIRGKDAPADEGL